MKKALKIVGAAAIGALLLTGGASGCASDADTAAENLSTKAEKLEVERQITVVNGRTGEVTFETLGRCSVEFEGTQRLITLCKHGENDFRKHYTVLGDAGMVQITQMGPIDVSVYRTEIIIKPETALPDFDVETSGDLEGDG